MTENAGSKAEIAIAVTEGEIGAAVRYVTADVGRHGGRVRVLHVVPSMELDGLPVPMVLDRGLLRRAGAAVADAATAVLEHELPETVVVPTVLHGSTVAELVGWTRGVRAIVLQRRARGWRRAMTLSTVNGVAAHAHAPAVMVPDGWEPEPAHERVVVVGIDDLLTSRGVVETGFREAADRGATLRLVHAWLTGGPYDDIILDEAACEAHEKELLYVFERELESTARAHPEVHVDVVLEHQPASEALVRESDGAGLLVLGRHRPAVPWGPHLGSVVRAVLRESACPVMVVDPDVTP